MNNQATTRLSIIGKKELHRNPFWFSSSFLEDSTLLDTLPTPSDLPMVYRGDSLDNLSIKLEVN